ncbi:MAG: hypothetical protein ACJ76F_03585, partial [Bacteroidia bacterium]
MTSGIRAWNYFYIATGLFFTLSVMLLIRDVSLWMISFVLFSFIFTGYILSFFRMDKLYKLLILCLPFSINTDIGSGTSILLLSEPLTGLIALATIFALFSGREKPAVSFFEHPLSLFVSGYLFFTLISLGFSSMPLVSLKSLVVKCTYIIAFYIAPYLLFRRDPLPANKIYLLYGIALLPVIFYALSQHANYDFAKESSAVTPLPFFSDHTIYSACLTFVIPPLLIHLFFSKVFSTGFFMRSLL